MVDCEVCGEEKASSIYICAECLGKHQRKKDKFILELYERTHDRIEYEIKKLETDLKFLEKWKKEYKKLKQ
jgi:hypothetical protein